MAAPQILISARKQVQNFFPVVSHRTLDKALKDRVNNLNFIRLVAALLVIVDHAFPLSNRPHWLAPRMGFSIGSLAVNTFFFLSGLLIARSWLEDPRPLHFFVKRISRILPGLYVAVLFCALVIGPLTTEMGLSDYLRNPLTRDYIFNNFLIFPIQYQLPQVFANNPYPIAVNGSIWTLPLELFAYFGILLLGFTQLLKRRYAMLGLFAFIAFMDFHVVTDKAFLGKTGMWFYMPTVQLWPLMLTFSFGTICYLFREYIVLDVKAGFVALATFILLFNTGAVLVGLTFLWSYVLLVFGFQRWPICQTLTSKGDFSFGIYIYAFPIQQLIMYKWPTINPFVQIALAVPITYLLAATSWYLVEKPSLRAKELLRPKKQEAVTAVQTS